MNIPEIDSAQLKAAVKEVLIEDKNLLKEVLIEIIQEHKQEPVSPSDEEFWNGLKQVFAEHDETFRRLA